MWFLQSYLAISFYAVGLCVIQLLLYRLYRAMLCIRGTSHGPVSVYVRLSVSVTSRSSTKTAKQRITQTTPHDSPGIPSFLIQKISAKFDRGHPLRGTKCRWGGSKSATIEK